MNKKESKIGFFDSGIGGLLILRATKRLLPQYDYVYFGDTKNLPYGDKSQQEIFNLTIKAIKYLKGKGCSLVIIACNTASAKALRKVQQEWLPASEPSLKVLGVLVPTIEAVKQEDFPALLIATQSTVKSKAYDTELGKVFANKKLLSKATPKLVPLIEGGKLEEASRVATGTVKQYEGKINSLILGCTHYPLLSKVLSKNFPKIKIIDQTLIIPKAIKSYLSRHKEIKGNLSTNKSVEIHFSKNTKTIKKLAAQWFGQS